MLLSFSRSFVSLGGAAAGRVAQHGRPAGQQLIASSPHALRTRPPRWQLLEEGATVLAMSDSLGYIYEPAGFTLAGLEQVGWRDGLAACSAGPAQAGARGWLGRAPLPGRLLEADPPPAELDPPPLSVPLPAPPPPHALLTPQVMAIKSSHSGKLRDYKSDTAQ